MRANATFSGVGGLVALAGFAPIAAFLGAERVLVAATGFGLMTFAVFVSVVASTNPRNVLRCSLAISVADAIWVVATGLVIGVTELKSEAAPLLGGVALVVGGFALAQLRLRSAARHMDDLDTPIAERVRVERLMHADATQVWELMTDHELYGRLALNLSKVEVLDGAGRGMVRSCHDAVGRGWNETCTLWDEGRQFAVDVDTSNYPYPLEVMRGTWTVEPAADRSRATMEFEFVPTSSVSGGLFANVMLLSAKPIARRILRGWGRELKTTTQHRDEHRTHTPEPSPGRH